MKRSFQRRLQGQVAIVTGSGRGIGKAIAMALSEEGCAVVVVARNESEIRRTQSEIAALGNKVNAIRGDVSRYEDVKKIVRDTVAEFHRLDILVNNAGVAVYKPLLETTEGEWDSIVNTNLKGMFLFIREALPMMMEQGHGRIINIASGNGIKGAMNLSAYSASKFGVVGFTQSVAQEVNKCGIKVYDVAPNCVDTQMFRELFGVLPKRTPEDIAKKVVWLCLPDCKTKSGSSIWIPPARSSLLSSLYSFGRSLLPEKVRRTAVRILRRGQRTVDK